MYVDTASGKLHKNHTLKLCLLVHKFWFYKLVVYFAVLSLKQGVHCRAMFLIRNRQAIGGGGGYL
jgi:hypothetical protein